MVHRAHVVVITLLGSWFSLKAQEIAGEFAAPAIHNSSVNQQEQILHAIHQTLHDMHPTTRASLSRLAPHLSNNTPLLRRTEEKAEEKTELSTTTSPHKKISSSQIAIGVVLSFASGIAHTVSPSIWYALGITGGLGIGVIPAEDIRNGLYHAATRSRNLGGQAFSSCKQVCAKAFCCSRRKRDE